MGLILTHVCIEDYVNKRTLYSKIIRGKFDFYIEANKNGENSLRLSLYRSHPRIKEFIDANEKISHLTVQETELESKSEQLRIILDDKITFMIQASDLKKINITEYNSKKDLSDLPHGKIGIIIDIYAKSFNNYDSLLKELKPYCYEEIKDER